MDAKCATCDKTFTGTSKPVKCELCMKTHHSSCTKFSSVRLEDDKIKKVCSLCLAAANPSSALRRTNSASLSTSPGGPLSSRAASPAQLPKPSAAEVLAALNARIPQLDKIEMIASSVANIESRVTSIDEHVASIDSRVKALEANSENMNARLQSAEERLVSTGTELSKLQGDVATALDETSAKMDEQTMKLNSLEQRITALEEREAEQPTGDEKIQDLVTSNASLTAKVHKLELKQAISSHASDIVIGGVPVGDDTNLRSAALTIIKAILPDFDDGNIQAVKLMPSKSSVSHSKSVPAVVDQNIDMHDVDTGSSGLNVTTASTRDTLLVTLSTATVAKNVIGAKIIRKKLTTAQLSPQLAAAANMKLPDRPSTININEFLPKELYQLKTMVYKKSRDKKNNFISYMRDGLIYARKKDESTSILITSSDDLSRFLGEFLAHTEGPPTD